VVDSHGFGHCQRVSEADQSFNDARWFAQPMSSLPTLRRPEYTGDRRCWPCTILNLAILSPLVLAVASVRILPAALLAVVGLAGIWLRGYVVPFTPRFAPQIARALPGDAFGHTTPSDTLGDLEAATDGEAVLEALVTAGVVEVSEGSVGLSPWFASEWEGRIEELAGASDETLLTTATETLEGVESTRIETTGDGQYLVVSGAGTTAWLRWPVALAEVAAAATLVDTDLGGRRRELAAHALCAFLDTCPVCDTELVEGPADDCCGNTVPAPGHDPPDVLACERCGVAFYTVETPETTDVESGA